MFNKYLITATSKTTNEVLHTETVLLFGLLAYVFVGGMMNDPYRGTATWTYRKINKGIVTKLFDYLIKVYYNTFIVNKRR